MIPSANTTYSNPVLGSIRAWARRGSERAVKSDVGVSSPHPLQVMRRLRTMRLGLLVPFQGTDAIWGPSCQFSAVLAAAELNEREGILGREVELFAADAGGDPYAVVERTRELVDTYRVDALIGVHLSSVRVALRDAFGGIVPYVFAPLYEGGETRSGVFAIGETPERQFPSAIRWLIEERKAKRWMLVGNDYVWPRASHRAIRQYVSEFDGELVGEAYLGLGNDHVAQVIESIAEAKPDVVFQSLVGTDCVRFNRAFARAGLARRILRLSGAIEENTLFGIGRRYTQNLYCVASYFNALSTPENLAFLERYRRAFGVTAPVQGVLSQSCYEAIRFFAALAQSAGSTEIADLDLAYKDLEFRGARGLTVVREGEIHAPMYLARADGTAFSILKTF